MRKPPPIAPKKLHIKRYVKIEHDMFQSVPYRLLSAKDLWVLGRFLQKRTWIKNKQGRPKYLKDPLSFPYSEAKAYGISKAQFHRCLCRLVEVGFIDPEHRGGAHSRDFSTYLLSDRWRKYGKPEFKNKILKRVLLPGHDVHSRKKNKK